MALIDSSIYQNAPRSLIREGLMGYDNAMKAKTAGINQRGLLAQQNEYTRSQEFNKTLGLLAQTNDHRTPEGQQAIIRGLGQKGFGAEAMELAQKFPRPAQPEYDLREDANGLMATNKGNPLESIRVPGFTPKAPKPEGPTAYEIAKDEWERKFKERQLNQSGANTAKDNALAESKFEVAKAKAEAEMARKAVDVPEAEAQADAAVSLIDQMIGSEDGAIKRHPGFGGAVGMKGPSSFFGLKSDPIGGTAAADFAALYEQVKGGAFLEAVSKMKGSGALSDTEGKAATSAISRMKTSQSEAEFMKAAKEFRAAIKGRKSRMIAKAASGAPGFSGPKAGAVEDGYRFKGGDPADPKNWEKQ